MVTIAKIKIRALANIRLTINRDVIEIPAGNYIYLHRPTRRFLVQASGLEARGSVRLSYIYNRPRERANWQKEGF